MAIINCSEQFDLQSIIGLESITVVNCSQSQIDSIIELSSVRCIKILDSFMTQIVITRDIEKLTVRYCKELKLIKFKNISNELSVRNLDNVSIDHGYLGHDFIIKNCHNLKIINDSYDGNAGLHIIESNGITFPGKKIWFSEYFTIENSTNINFM